MLTPDAIRDVCNPPLRLHGQANDLLLRAKTHSGLEQQAALFGGMAILIEYIKQKTIDMYGAAVLEDNLSVDKFQAVPVFDQSGGLTVSVEDLQSFHKNLQLRAREKASSIRTTATS